MKGEEEGITLDNFKLQLNDLQQIESDLLSKKHPKQQFFIYNVDHFPISISMFASVSYSLIIMLWFIHILLTYYQIYSSITNIGLNMIFSIIQGILTNQFMGTLLSIVILVGIILGLFVRNQASDSGLMYILSYIGQRIYPYVRYLIEIIVYITAFSMMTIQLTSIIFFVFGSLLALLKTLLFQNFTLRKDEFYCKSIQFSLVFRLVILSSLVVDIVSLVSVTTFQSLIVASIFHCILSTLLVFCYFSFGLAMYRQKIARYSLIITIISYFCLSYSMLTDAINSLQNPNAKSVLFIIFPIILLPLGFCFISTLTKIRRHSNDPKHKSLKNKIFFFFNKYEQVDQDEQQDCEIRGIMHEHLQTGCKNLMCIVNIKEQYDSKKKKYCTINKIAQSKVSLIKFYVKCLYETELQIQKDNIDLKLDFAEFYYLKLKNVFSVLKLISQLELQYLTYFQKLRLVRLKKYLINESNCFSEQLYLKSLSMQKVLAAQQNFGIIQKKIEVVLDRNQLFWKYIERNQVNLTDILKTIKPNFELIDIINQEWAKLADFFQINRRWKFYYICYTIYIKNQKIKPSILEDFGNTVEFDSIFKTENYFIDKTTQKQQLFNPIMLFEQNTCFVHVSCDDEKMVITRASNYFKRNFDYQPHQIIMSTAGILMPPCVRNFHQEVFLQWVKQGRSNNQDFYTIKKIFPVTKRGYLNPCFKFYKRYIRLNGQIQYIAMFKRNRQDELVVLGNSIFQVEAITFGLSQKIKLNPGEYLYFRGLNLLSLMPMVVKYTKYAKFISENDEDFLQVDENRSYFKKQNSILKSNKNDGNVDIQDQNILQIRKTLNLSNIKLYLPTDLQVALDYYNLIKNKRSSEFEIIRQFYRWMRKSKNFIKFRVDLSIREKVVLGYKYYEIEINEIEENNRLQKMKMQQAQFQSNGSYSSCKDIQQNKLNNIDLELFFHVSKKKNKVILFPSNNIFIKDESNRALQQISHIKNIGYILRFMIAVFLSIIFSFMIVQITYTSNVVLLNTQYFLASHHQKLQFMLNNQFNIQHVQPGNGVESLFHIVQYTHKVIHILSTIQFQTLIYDDTLNLPGLYSSYSDTKYYFLPQNMSLPLLDEISLLFKIYETLVSIHRDAEKDHSDPLQTMEYYQFNEYIYSYYKKSQIIKSILQTKFQSMYTELSSIILAFAVTQAILIVACFLFIITRLCKVADGFQELVSIFIQMDNKDIKKILKFTNYVHSLFDHLNDKNIKMTMNSEYFSSSSSSAIRQLEKGSSELSVGQQTAHLINANLNKKIKKIQFADEIKKLINWSIFLKVIFILLVSIGVFVLSVYSTMTMNSYKLLQNSGFEMMIYNTAPNIVLNGVLQKYRNSTLFSTDKYSEYINYFQQTIANNKEISISQNQFEFQNIFKQVYFDNFCQIFPNVINQTYSEALLSACGPINSTSSNIGSQCSQLLSIVANQAMANRCQTIQDGQLTKGANNYYNYFNGKTLKTIENVNQTITLRDFVEINDAQKLIDIFDEYLMQKWNIQSIAYYSNRQTYIIIIAMCSALFIIIVHIVLIELISTNYLNRNYEIFRRIHQYLIPEFVINKQKIIKAKLVKEGFMKE